MVETAITNILLSIAALLFVSIAFGELFERFGLDAVLGYLVAGLLLGPSVLNWINPHLVEDFAIVGAVLILFMAGLKESSAADIYKDRTAVKIGLSLLVGTFIAMMVMLFLIKQFNYTQMIFLALAFAVVDLGVPAKLMLSTGILNTKFGRNTLNAGVINVISGLGLLVLITMFFNPSFNAVLLKIAGIGGFILLFLGLSYVMNHLSRTILMLRSEEVQFSIAFVTVLLLAYVTEIIGFSSILGAFLAGIVISRARFAGTHEFAEKLKGVSLGFFVPLFFGWFGLELILWGPEGIIANIAYGLLFFGVAVGSKFLISYFMAKKKQIPYPGLMASSMLSLDVESLVILLLALQIGVFTNKLPISIFAISVPATTFTVSVLYPLFRKLEKVKVTT
jgi:Kef-type K+ transport system membrane component KefB